MNPGKEERTKEVTVNQSYIGNGFAQMNIGSDFVMNRINSYKQKVG